MVLIYDSVKRNMYMDNINTKEELVKKLRDIQISICLSKLAKLLTANGAIISDALLISDIFHNKTLDTNNGLNYKIYIAMLLIQILIYTSSNYTKEKAEEDYVKYLNIINKENTDSN